MLVRTAPSSKSTFPRVVERDDTFAGESESTLDEDLERNAAVERRVRKKLLLSSELSNEMMNDRI